MKIRIAIIFSSLILLNKEGFTQKNKIFAVEHNLTEVRELIFEDSLLPKYSIADRMSFYKVPSVSIAVINNGKIEWVRTYGYADSKTQRPAKPNTLYQVASVSKSVTGLGFMKLAQDKKLSLTKDIRTYLKSWRLPENEFTTGKTITLKNLLSHTAGLNVHGFIGYSVYDPLPTINQILNGEKPANNEAVKPMFPATEHFEYSGGGYTVLRKILDDNISTNFDSILQKTVLRPLKMTNSTFSQPLSAIYENYAYGHDEKMQPLKGNYYIYPDQAAGGLWSTATDIAKFVLEIQAELKSKKGSLIPPESANEMLSPVLNNYGLGFGIREIGGEKYFSHEGENYGYNAMYYGSFTTGKGVVILTNAYPNNGKPFIRELLNSVATVYDWKDFYKPVKKKLAAVPDSILIKYAGDYYCENPPVKISITKTNSGLELTARRTEKMYAITHNSFFLASAPEDRCVFSSSKNDGVIDTLEVIQNGQTIIKAVLKNK